MDKRYRIELNERQLKVMYNALEEWFRISLGQFQRTAERLTYDSKKDVKSEEIPALREKSLCAYKCMDAGYYIATDGELVMDEAYHISVDMWHALRCKIYHIVRTRWDSQESDEPPIKVEEIENDG